MKILVDSEVKKKKRFIENAHEYGTNKSLGCLIATTKFLGIGIDLDFDNPYSDREKLFSFQITILFLRFWHIQFKNKLRN